MAEPGALAPETLMPGVATEVAPNVVRLVAPNPGVMTGPGTNSYVVGDTTLAVIDPGPNDVTHLDALAGLVGDRLAYVLVTHTHPDHAPGAAELCARTGAEALGFGSRDGFACDRELRDADVVDLGAVLLTAAHTPGHASNHLCYLASWAGASGSQLCFSGDHVMSGSTVVISPPDGDMTAYLANLERLLALDPPLSAIAPGHGSMIADPQAVLEGYLAHRLAREAAVSAALSARGEASVDELVADVYTDVASGLHVIARRSLWAHLRKLATDGRARTDRPDDIDARWQIVPIR